MRKSIIYIIGTITNKNFQVSVQNTKFFIQYSLGSMVGVDCIFDPRYSTLGNTIFPENRGSIWGSIVWSTLGATPGLLQLPEYHGSMRGSIPGVDGAGRIMRPPNPESVLYSDSKFIFPHFFSVSTHSGSSSCYSVSRPGLVTLSPSFDYHIVSTGIFSLPYLFLGFYTLVLTQIT